MLIILQLLLSFHISGYQKEYKQDFLTYRKLTNNGADLLRSRISRVKLLPKVNTIVSGISGQKWGGPCYWLLLW